MRRDQARMRELFEMERESRIRKSQPLRNSPCRKSFRALLDQKSKYGKASLLRKTRQCC